MTKEHNGGETMTKHYNDATGLFTDATNAWSKAQAIVSHENGIDSFASDNRFCMPIKHYEEYFAQAYPQFLEMIMQKSDPNSVQNFNDLVDEYNKALPEIIQNKDIEKVKTFLERMNKLING